MSFNKYRADIDGLRALAIISVVGYHAFPHLLPAGFIGVDIFFVISGYLISIILFDSLETNSFSFQSFFARRILRIFPALFIVLITCLIFGYFALFSTEYKQLAKHVAAGASFVSNFLLWQEAGYFDTASDYKPLLHLWSLSIEEQFYILWPLLLLFVWKKRLNLFVIISFILILSFACNVISIHFNASTTFYSPPTRFWELMCGSWLAWLRLKSKNLDLEPVSIVNLMSLIGISLIISSHFLIKKSYSYPGVWAILPIIGAAFLITSGTKAWTNKIVLSNPILIWIGLISYPLYLWHWPILAFIKIMEPTPQSKLMRCLGIGLAILLSWLTYKLVEIPIRFDKKVCYRKKTMFLIFLMSCAGGLGALIYFKSGFIQRTNEANGVAALIANPLPKVEDFECGQLIPELKNYNFDGGCKLSKNTLPDVMFIGDSHADHYRNAIWKQFSNHSVLMIVQTSCLPFSSNHFLKGSCRKKYEAILSFLSNNSSIKRVYLSGYWAYLIAGGFAFEHDNWRQPKSFNSQTKNSFLKNAKRFISAILRSQKEIIFLKDIPNLDFNINNCFKVRPLRLSFQPIRNDRWVNFNNYQKRVYLYEEVIDDLLNNFKGKISVFDPKPLFCRKNRCYAKDARFPYYWNGDHLNQYGANHVITNLHKNFYF